jgi:hypothetical protein
MAKYFPSRIYAGYRGVATIAGTQLRFENADIAAKQTVNMPDLVTGDFDRNAYNYAKIEYGGNISGPITESFLAGSDSILKWACQRNNDFSTAPRCGGLTSNDIYLYYYCNKARQFRNFLVNSLTITAQAGEVATFSLDVIGIDADDWENETSPPHKTAAEKLLTWDKVNVSIIPNVNIASFHDPADNPPNTPDSSSTPNSGFADPNSSYTCPDSTNTFTDPKDIPHYNEHPTNNPDDQTATDNVYLRSFPGNPSFDTQAIQLPFQNFTFTVANNVEPQYSLSQSNLKPFDVIPGQRQISGSFTAYNVPDFHGFDNFDDYCAGVLCGPNFPFENDDPSCNGPTINEHLVKFSLSSECPDPDIGAEIIMRVRFNRVEPTLSAGVITSNVAFNGVGHQSGELWEVISSTSAGFGTFVNPNFQFIPGTIS